MSAITVEDLGKRYVIDHERRSDTLRDALSLGVRGLWNKLRASAAAHRTSREEFWALRDVSFSVAPGEVVGIIGRNGAGKSTLLKILSRITEPTQGNVRIRGRAASLLEVGTGFHPELTGRENIFLNGAILGMSRAEIRGKFDEIVAFAEIDRFLDTPVKRYSSGMYVRLAFAVAAHLEPEILIVDEVLAVGDAAFQKRCLGKMRSIVQGEGRTILFVSHDMAAITALTHNCLLLQHGQIAAAGSTSDVVGRYFDGNAARQLDYVAERRTNEQPHVRRVQVRTSQKPGVQAAGHAMDVVIELSHPHAVAGACVSFQLTNQFNQAATHRWIFDTDVPYARAPGSTILTCRMPNVRLNVGHYALRVYFSEPPGGTTFETLDGICPFEVVRLGETTLWGWRPDACVYHEDASWTVEAQRS